MCVRLKCWFWMVPLLIAASGGVLDAQQPALVLLDGKTLAATEFEIAAGQVRAQGLPEELAIDDLRRIELGQKVVIPSEKPQVVVELRARGRLSGKSATIGDEKCVVIGPFGEVAIPIDALRAIRFQPSTQQPDLDKAIQAPSADQDRIFFTVDGKSGSVSGLIESLSDKELSFQIEGQTRTIPRDRLVGIVIAQPLADDAAAPALAIFTDGSQVGGELVSLNREKLVLGPPGGGEISVPRSAVASIQIRSAREVFLSDLKPLAAEQQAIVTLPRPWQADRSVLGGPLTIGNRVFEKGIGVQARSSLTFAAEARFDTLAAVIGIDAETGGKGDCNFSVLGDGQSLFSRRMKGSDAPHEMQINIAGVRQITLLVEPGADLDLSDHADWGDLRMIKQSERMSK